MNEVVEAIKAFEKEKAPGDDRINGEMLKNVDPEAIKMQQYSLEERKLPLNCKAGIVVPIFFKGG